MLMGKDEQINVVFSIGYPIRLSLLPHKTK